MTHNELPCEDYYTDEQPACEYCDGTVNVSWTPDPYDSDVLNDSTPHYICKNCEYERAMEV